MLGRLVVGSLVGVGVASGSAWAQFVPPIPERSAPDREYEIPERAPAPPTVPAAERPANPGQPGESIPTGATLVNMGEDGRIVRLDVHPDIAALRLIELDDTRRDAAGRALAARKAEMGEVVRQRLGELCGLRGRIDSATVEWKVADLLALSRDAKKLTPQRPIERLVSAGVLGPSEAREVRRLASEYESAIQRERTGEVGHSNIPEMTFLAFRMQTGQATGELFDVMDRALIGMIDRMGDWESTLNLSRNQVGKLADLRGSLDDAADNAERAELVRGFVCGVLTDAQRELLMPAGE